MRLLSFDTCTELLCVSLMLDGKTVCELSVDRLNPPSDVKATVSHPREASGEPLKLSDSEKVQAPSVMYATGAKPKRNAKAAPRQEVATALMPLVDEAFEQTGWSRTELDGIVVGVGPGSFTGIRTGVVTARTLAQSMNLPLIPISLLEVYASEIELPSGLIMAAGKGHYFIGGYEQDECSPGANRVEWWCQQRSYLKGNFQFNLYLAARNSCCSSKNAALGCRSGYLLGAD